MAYYDNPGTNPDEAINIVNGKVFNVVQLADIEGNVVDPGSSGSSNQQVVDGVNSIDSKLPSLTNGKIPVDLGGASVTIAGNVTVSNEVEVTNNVGNPIPVSTPPTSPTTTRVPSSASSVTITTQNNSRKGLGVCNLSTANLYLSFSSPASTTNCFMSVPGGAFILLDQQLIIPNAIYGLWDGVDGGVQVTEFV